ENGVIHHIMHILQDYQISYEHMPSGIDDVSIIMRSNQFENHNSLDKIIEEIDLQLEPEWIEVEEDLSLLFIVGLGMARQIGIVSRVTAALAEDRKSVV